MDQEEENCPVEASIEDSSVNSSTQKSLMSCPICKKGFPTPSKVKRHLLAVHEKIREFQCDICSHAFSQKIHVLKHRQAVHKRELEANPELLAKKDFRIPADGSSNGATVAITTAKPAEAFSDQQQPSTFQTVKVDKSKKSRRKSRIQQVTTQVSAPCMVKPLVTGTTETKVYFELRLDPQVLNIDLSKLTAIEAPSTTTALVQQAQQQQPLPQHVATASVPPNSKALTCQVKFEPVLDNQLTLDENKFDLNKLNQQNSFENELEKTLAQLQPIAKEFAAFEEDQGKIFQELVPLSDIKPSITEIKQEDMEKVAKADEANANSSSQSLVHKKSSSRKSNSISVSCSLCKKSFSSPSKLRRHVRIVHEKIKPFNCHICGKNFGQKVNLVGHLQSKHKLSEEEIKNKTQQMSSSCTSSLGNQSTTTTTTASVASSTKMISLKVDDSKKVFKCMECVFDSEDSGDMISHHLSTHVQTMFNFDTSELLLE